MVRLFRLSLIGILSLYAGNAYSSATLTPSTIKTQVESSSYYNGYGSQTTDQVAQNVLASNSLDALLANCPIETMVSWNNGKTFISSLRYRADETAKEKIAASCKIYIQKQLKKVWLGDIATLTSPTALHALNDIDNTDSIVSDLDTSSNYKHHLKTIAPLLCTLIKEEKVLSDKGYCVFFHGQRWHYLFGEKLYTDLWALTQHKARPTNYLFPHVRVGSIDPEKYKKLDRKKLLRTGAGWGDEGRNTLLFTTNSLFSNYQGCSTSSALSFFLTNGNLGSISFSLYDIFTHYKLDHLYSNHAQEITTLESHFNAARTFGTLLRVAIPKTMVRDYCFRTSCGTVIHPDTPAFLQELITKPASTLNNEAFCIVMLDEAMNPEGSIMIKAYHCAEQTEWQKFEAGYEQLIQKLAAEINPPATTSKPSAVATKKPLKKK